MLECKLQEPKVFRSVVEAMSEHIKECNFEFTREGLKMQALDSSHIAFTFVTLSATWWNEYRCDDEALLLGVNLETLLKILKCGPDNSLLALSYENDDDEVSELKVKFEVDRGEKKDVAEFALKLTHIDPMEEEVPELTWTNELEMPTQELFRIARDISLFSEIMVLEFDKDKLRISCSSKESTADYLVHPFEDSTNASNSVRMNIEAPFKVSLTTHYVLSFAKNKNINERVVIKMIDAETPLMFSFSMKEGSGICYYIAGRLTDD
ncbi:hypothetical protein CANCADRAFT_4296 [Tortispora caseinolytica NRRL Y-17796]|uniref:DNA sliding clamp PCNA n=1 Tax=Tortispora caseinolytica NRRL Y-17796 TaxID=767744 RepID=A0A1E4TD23_9ASCO|nr:hypothetical protein CANCADRAFT_4296 [Tortispora caseinolytica NRRL Y-17796]